MTGGLEAGKTVFVCYINIDFFVLYYVELHIHAMKTTVIFLFEKQKNNLFYATNIIWKISTSKKYDIALCPLSIKQWVQFGLISIFNKTFDRDVLKSRHLSFKLTYRLKTGHVYRL